MSKRPSGLLSVSRDTLNPLLNTETLRNRLAVIEHYKYLHGVQRAHWPHFAMQRAARYLMRYKVNLLVKAGAGYLVYNDYQHWRVMHETTLPTLQQEANMFMNMGIHTGAFLGLCFLI